MAQRVYREARKMKKYCFAASMGGHLEEIACLKDIAREVDSFLVTEKGGFQEIRFCNRTRYVLQINRKEKTFLFKNSAILPAFTYLIGNTIENEEISGYEKTIAAEEEKIEEANTEENKSEEEKETEEE